MVLHQKHGDRVRLLAFPENVESGINNVLMGCIDRGFSPAWHNTAISVILSAAKNLSTMLT